MNEPEWIGIQFNLEKDLGLKKWIKKYEHLGFETDGEHITLNFTSRDLKELSKGNFNELEIIKESIKKCLQYSISTDIYTYLDADALSAEKQKLLNGAFETLICIEEIDKESTLLENFQQKVKAPGVLEILKTNSLMTALNAIFEFVVTRNFAEEQKLSLELTYEDKYEWDADRDNLNVSIHLEILGARKWGLDF